LASPEKLITQNERKLRSVREAKKKQKLVTDIYKKKKERNNRI